MQVEEEPSEKTKKVERDAKKVRRMYNLTQSNEASTQRSVLARIITLADASVWCPSVCLSVCPIFSDLYREHAVTAHIQCDSPRCERDAANIHFHSGNSRTDKCSSVCWYNILVSQ